LFISIVHSQKESFLHNGEFMGEKFTGKVKWYNSQRGFGLISGSNGKKYFVHSSQLSSKVGRIRIGTRPIFKIMPRLHNKGGYEATHVEIDISPLLGTSKPLTFRPLVQPSKSAADSDDDYWYQSYTSKLDNRSSAKKPIETKVVGVTYEGRQSIVALLKVGEEVQLIREPENPYDRNSIRVLRKNGQCLGFIGKLLAAELAPKFDNYGKPVEAVVTSITGGYYSNSNLGVTIKFNLPEITNSDTDFD